MKRAQSSGVSTSLSARKRTVFNLSAFARASVALKTWSLLQGMARNNSGRV